LMCFVQSGCLTYRDKKVVGVFLCVFRAPLQRQGHHSDLLRTIDSAVQCFLHRINRLQAIEVTDVQFKRKERVPNGVFMLE
jgi:hypothetical protein